MTRASGLQLFYEAWSGRRESNPRMQLGKTNHKIFSIYFTPLQLVEIIVFYAIVGVRGLSISAHKING
jgi:hypothetical protein